MRRSLSVHRFTLASASELTLSNGWLLARQITELLVLEVGAPEGGGAASVAQAVSAGGVGTSHRLFVALSPVVGGGSDPLSLSIDAADSSGGLVPISETLQVKQPLRSAFALNFLGALYASHQPPLMIG